MFKTRPFIVGTSVSLLFVGLFVYKISVRDMISALNQAEYSYLGPAVALYFMAVFVRAVRWQYIMMPVSKISTLRLFPVVTVGYMANNLLPARLGEVVRAYYLSRREGVSSGTGLATIIIERVYDGLTLIFLSLITVPFIIFSGLTAGSGAASAISWSISGFVAIFGFVTAIVLLTFLASNPKSGGFVEMFPRFVPRTIRPKVKELIGFFIEGLYVLREPRRQIGVFVLSLPVWLLEGSMYLLIALSFDLPSLFSPAILIVPVIILVTSVSNIATSIPSSPGSIGTFEVAAAAVLTLVGVTEGVAGAFVLLVHMALLVPVTILGLVYLWSGSISLSSLTGQAPDKASTGVFSDDRLLTNRRDK